MAHSSAQMMVLSIFANMLLNDACPMDVADADGWQQYYFESHCVGYTVTARCVDGAWTIKGVEATSV